ncbi:hypothetical protein PVAG01_06442 [Phlyctema vagabunda]|uniref:RNase H type-1 domain-containing protein n=1 Tax=Phlyctema vagabunda TaxID=108571 RepID=A0ABR4PGZ9_9HELO
MSRQATLLFDYERHGWDVIETTAFPIVRRLSSDPESIVVSVHGACRRNGGLNPRGGYGVFFGESSTLNRNGRCEVISRQTNQYAELYATMLALEAIYQLIAEGEVVRHIVIRNNSENLTRAFTQRVELWGRRKWRTKTGKKVANVRGIQSIMRKIRRLEAMCDAQVSFAFVGLEYNRRAAELSTDALGNVVQGVVTPEHGVFHAQELAQDQFELEKAELERRIEIQQVELRLAKLKYMDDLREVEVMDDLQHHRREQQAKADSRVTSNRKHDQFQYFEHPQFTEQRHAPPPVYVAQDQYAELQQLETIHQKPEPPREPRADRQASHRQPEPPRGPKADRQPSQTQSQHYQEERQRWDHRYSDAYRPQYSSQEGNGRYDKYRPQYTSREDTSRPREEVQQPEQHHYQPEEYHQPREYNQSQAYYQPEEHRQEVMPSQNEAVFQQAVWTDSNSGW